MDKSLRSKYIAHELTRRYGKVPYGRKHIFKYYGTFPIFNPEQRQQWIKAWQDIGRLLFTKGGDAETLKWHLPQVFPGDELYTIAEPVAKALVDSGIPVYHISENDSFLVETPHGYQIIGRRQWIEMDNIGPSYFIEMLLAHWELSLSFLKYKLLNEMSVFIRELNRNFDEACAVSENGTQLVSADKVVIVYHSGREQGLPYTTEEYDAKIFHKIKLIRPPLQNSTKDDDPEGLVKAMRSIADSHWDSYFCRKQGINRDKNYYVISMQHVPVDLLIKATSRVK